MAKRFGRIKDYADWLKPKLVANALELLSHEIPKFRKQIDFVHLCFTTDPFMYGYDEVEDLTLKIIEKLSNNDIRTNVLTKGIYPKVLDNKETYGRDNAYGISLVSLDEHFRRRFEPFSAPFEDRIDSLKYLRDVGLKTWVSIEPYPTPNLFEQDLSEILDAVSFVDTIVFGKLNYNIKASHCNSSRDFYESCAGTVIDFCRKSDIKYHIKNGTQVQDDKTTTNISNKAIVFS
jgi:DNA repair photolyase